MANFEVDTEQRSAEVVIRLSGDLDLDSFDAVDEVLKSAQSNVNRIVRYRSQRFGFHRFDRDQTPPGRP